MLVDAHAHLDKYDDAEIDQVLAVIEQRRIFTMSVSVDPESYARAQTIAARSRLVVPSFGIHPEQAPVFVDSLAEIEELVDGSPLVGEIGLDHRFVTDAAQYGSQREVFAIQLALAKAQGKLVNLHCAGAEQDTFDMLVAHGVERAIVHWYSGPLDVLKRMVAAGYLFTAGVEVLHSAHLRDVAQAIPADQLLTETDNPGGYRWLTGDTGYPAHLGDVVGELARLRAVHPDDLATTVRRNLIRLLEGDPHLASWLAELV